MTHRNVTHNVVTTVGNITIRTHMFTTEIELNTSLDGEKSESLYLEKRDLKSLIEALTEFTEATKEG